MTVITSYPGIYVSEDATPGISIATSATAVPAFAFTRASSDGSPADEVTVFYSWNEASLIFNSGSIDYAQKDYYKSLYTWFMGGGGKCYLVQADKLEEAIGKNDDITLLVAAGTTGNAFSTAFNSLTSRGYPIFGLFDGPKDKITGGADSVMSNLPVSPYGAAFYPWCQSAAFTNIPPSVIAAVSMAQTDRSRGVWKAPANQPINGVTPMFPVSDELQGQFSGEKPLNMIRSFPETGTVIWGTRTLDNSDNWRFIPVRRLFNTVERDIKRALNRMVFEPNNQPTWQRVKAAVDNYLRSLWQDGALMGDKPEEAWFVQIGKGSTMTEEDIRQRKMILVIGIAAVHPAVFIHLQFTQIIAQ